MRFEIPVDPGDSAARVANSVGLLESAAILRAGSPYLDQTPGTREGVTPPPDSAYRGMPPGIGLTSVPRPLRRSFSSRFLDLQSGSLVAYADEPHQADQGYAVDAGAARRCARLARQLAAHLEAPVGLGALAADELRKWFPEVRQFPKGWAVVQKPVVRSVVPDELRQALAWVGKCLAASYDPDDEAGPFKVKRNTATGHPFHTTSDVARGLAFRVASSLYFRRSADARVVTDALSAACALDLPSLPCPPMVQLHRTGPTRKPTITYNAGVDGYTPEASVPDRSCRVRSVRSVAAWYNELLRAYIMSLTKAAKRHPVLGPFWQHGARAASYVRWRYRATGAYTFSVDYSSYDDTISRDLLLALLDYLPTPTPYARNARSWMALFDDHYLLTSSPSPQFAAWLLALTGTNRSGMIYTSFVATALNVALCFYGLARAARRPVAAVIADAEAGHLFAQFQGDDTLVNYNRPVPRDDFASALADVGIIANVEDHPVFLKNWYGSTGAHGLAYRAVMRTLTSESPPFDPDLWLFSAAARWGLVLDDPTVHDCWDAVQALPGPLSGYRSVRDMLRAAQQPTYLSKVQQLLERTAPGPEYARRLAAAYAQAAGAEFDELSENDAPMQFMLARVGALRALVRSEILFTPRQDGNEEFEDVLPDIEKWASERTDTSDAANYAELVARLES